MASYNFDYKKNAEKKLRQMRKKGYECSVYPKKKGYGVSVTRK